MLPIVITLAIGHAMALGAYVPTPTTVLPAPPIAAMSEISGLQTQATAAATGDECDDLVGKKEQGELRSTDPTGIGALCNNPTCEDCSGDGGAFKDDNANDCDKFAEVIVNGDTVTIQQCNFGAMFQGAGRIYEDNYACTGANKPDYCGSFLKVGCLVKSAASECPAAPWLVELKPNKVPTSADGENTCTHGSQCQSGYCGGFCTGEVEDCPAGELAWAKVTAFEQAGLAECAGCHAIASNNGGRECGADNTSTVGCACMQEPCALTSGVSCSVNPEQAKLLVNVTAWNDECELLNILDPSTEVQAKGCWTELTHWLAVTRTVAQDVKGEGILGQELDHQNYTISGCYSVEFEAKRTLDGIVTALANVADQVREENATIYNALGDIVVEMEKIRVAKEIFDTDLAACLAELAAKNSTELNLLWKELLILRHLAIPEFWQDGSTRGAVSTNAADYDQLHDNVGSCGAISTSTAGEGHEDAYRGWYDVQQCGRCNDYCRWTGNTSSGGDPAISKATLGGPNVPAGQPIWSCRMYSGEYNTFSDTEFPNGWNLKKCVGRGSMDQSWTPHAPVQNSFVETASEGQMDLSSAATMDQQRCRAFVSFIQQASRTHSFAFATPDCHQERVNLQTEFTATYNLIAGLYDAKHQEIVDQTIACENIAKAALHKADSMAYSNISDATEQIVESNQSLHFLVPLLHDLSKGELDMWEIVDDFNLSCTITTSSIAPPESHGDCSAVSPWPEHGTTQEQIQWGVDRVYCMVDSMGPCDTQRVDNDGEFVFNDDGTDTKWGLVFPDWSYPKGWWVDNEAEGGSRWTWEM